MDKPTKPEPKAPGEHEEGKYHYNPVGMAGKAEEPGEEADKAAANSKTDLDKSADR